MNHYSFFKGTYQLIFQVPSLHIIEYDDLDDLKFIVCAVHLLKNLQYFDYMLKRVHV